MQFEQRLLLHHETFNESDMQIAHFILNNSDYVLHHSIDQLSSTLFLSKNAITRLAKKMGYLSYNELLTHLGQEQKLLLTQYMETKPDVSDLSFFLPDRQLQHILSLLHQAPTVHFLGVGASQFLCDIAVKLLRCIDKPSHCYRHTQDMHAMTKQLKENDLVIIISMSGETFTLLEVAHAVLQTPAKLISLTHHQHNAIEQLAHMRLFCHAPKQYFQGYDVTDRTYALATLRHIIEHYWKLALASDADV